MLSLNQTTTMDENNFSDSNGKHFNSSNSNTNVEDMAIEEIHYKMVEIQQKSRQMLKMIEK